MQLTSFQRKILERQLRLRHTGPTFAGMLRMVGPQLALFVLSVGVFSALMWWSGSDRFAAGLLGAMLAGVLQAFVALRNALHLWPVTRQVTDWPKVEQLLAGQAPRHDA